MEIWILTYILVLNGTYSTDTVETPNYTVCINTKEDLLEVEYKDTRPFQGITCERKE
jgi:hypothetical protein